MENNSLSNIDLQFEQSSNSKGKYLIFDVETTGLLPKNHNELTNLHEWPRILQVAWILFDEEGKQINAQNRYIKQSHPIPKKSIRIHGIDDKRIIEKGEKSITVWNDFVKDIDNCDYIVAHNIEFDITVIESELNRMNFFNRFAGKKKICTMQSGKDYCLIPDEDGSGYKYPALDEVYLKCFHPFDSITTITGLHDAYVDTAIAAKVFFFLLHQNHLQLSEAIAEPFKLSNSLFLNNEHKKGNKFFVNIILPTLFTIFFFIITIFFIIIPRIRENIMIVKREMTKELTNSAYSILVEYENEEKKGNLSSKQAQEAAISRIKYLRYGDENKDYFWLTDLHPTMIMHPYRSDLNGKDLSNFTDAHNKKLFVEFVKTVESNESGYVDYMWQWKDDSTHIVPKLSYVKIFKPWNWIIGTGIYLEDVKKEIESLTNKLILISLAISSVIALLLFYITRQSLIIERKRKTAEIKLRASREKYKTLVEATTDGLILIMDNKIVFTNNKFNQLIGYSLEELMGKSFTFLISKNNPEKVKKKFMDQNITDGKFELELNKKTGEAIDLLIQVSTIILSDKTSKILTLKDISLNPDVKLNSENLQTLLDEVDIGFIRIIPEEKFQVIYANNSMVNMLGYSSNKDLSRQNILDLIADQEDKKNLENLLIKKNKLNSIELRLKHKNNSIITVNANLKVYLNEQQQLICDGIVENITQQTKLVQDYKSIIAELHTKSSFMFQQVSSFVKHVGYTELESTASSILDQMNRQKYDAVVVRKSGEEFVGIITAKDIINRIILKGLTLDKLAYEFMSAPIISINSSTPIHEAIQLFNQNQFNHLIVKNENGSIAGMLSLQQLQSVFLTNYSFIEQQIQNAETDEELIHYYNHFVLYCQSLIVQANQIKNIGKIGASISKLITSQIIKLSIAQLGPPPVDFAFVALGSEGRKEQTLATDQDNAIIFEDNINTDFKINQEYFIRLGEKICFSLNKVGFKYCKGMIMARNPKWVQPLSQWKNYFTEWINTPEPKHLLDTSIFFDMRAIYGSHSFVDNLHQHIHSISYQNASFFYNLADNVLSFKPSISITGNLVTEKKADKEFIDLKYAVVPIIMFVRIYALQHNIKSINTEERLFSLYEKQIISQTTLNEILFSFHFLMNLRYKHQSEMIS